MSFITTLTQKGQITLPKTMRDQLNMLSYSKVTVEMAHDHLEVKPIEDILDLAGSLKPKKAKSADLARDQFAKQYRRF